MKKILYIILLIAWTPGLKAQFAAVLSEEGFTRLENDSAVLAPNKNLRGTFQWQKSTDSIHWANVESNISGDILTFVPEITEAYRLQITEGTCLPLYSDTIKVFSKNTTISEYQLAGISNQVLEASSRIRTFAFSHNGETINGKIFLPASYESNKNLPAIYLIDFTEQHFVVALDEFEKVIEGVEQIQGFDALVVTLEEHLDIDAQPSAYNKYYDTFKSMTSFVDDNYTSNTSRTFIGRGSESGIVLMTLFLEDSENSVFDNFIATDSPSSFNSTIVQLIKKDDFPKNKLNKKLHFSFSSSNSRSSCTGMINKINEAQYPWLQFESKEYAHKTYPDAYPTAFAEGLKFVFE